MAESADWHFFEYDPITKPFPAFPISELYGSSLLRVRRSLAPEGPFQLFWEQKPSFFVPALFNGADPRFQFAIVRDNSIVALLDEAPPSADGLLALQHTGRRELTDGPSLALISFGVMTGRTVRFTRPPLMHRFGMVMDKYEVLQNWLDGFVKDRRAYKTMIARAETEPPTPWEDIDGSAAFTNFSRRAQATAKKPPIIRVMFLLLATGKIAEASGSR
jgi:hypothetical protein